MDGSIDARVVSARQRLEELRPRAGELILEHQGLLAEAFDQWQQSLTALEQARQDMVSLSSTNQAKDRFLAFLSHELRTPLTPILASLSNLRHQHLDPAMAEAIDLMLRNLQTEMRLIDDLLDLTRISQGKLELRPQGVDVGVLLHHAIEICQQDIEAKHLRLELRLEAPHPVVQADSARLEQVFWNLLKNAVKFNPDGAVVRIVTSVEHSDPTRGPGTLVVSICDQGIGISPELLGRVFEPFVQGCKATCGQHGGLGLGLAISRAIAQAHGGDITVASAGVGQGATFTVRLPLSDQPPPAVCGEARGCAAEHVAVGAPARPMRILLVEDHADTLRLLSRLLRQMNHHQVYTADSFRAAAMTLEQQAIDVLVADLQLPDGNGLDLMRLARRLQPELRGIAVSGHGMHSDMLRSQAAGFDQHLVKPIDIEQLECALAQVMVNRAER